MTQQIINDYPPLFDEIDAAFNVRGKSIMFSFGDRLYNPEGIEIPPELVAHEAVHGERQSSGQRVRDWWRRYMADRLFRLNEEIPAHQAEYRYLLEHGNRYQRCSALRRTAARLAAPLYGRLIPPNAAELLLRTSEDSGDGTSPLFNFAPGGDSGLGSNGRPSGTSTNV